MKKKGFTLVEVLAVIIILGIVLIIAIPSVSKWLKNSKEESYHSQIKTMESGAESWASANTSLLPNNDNGKIVLTLGYLKTAGYAEENMKNPKTNELFSNDTLITITYINGGYQYKVNEDSTNTTTDSQYNEKGPRLALIGDLAVYLELNIDSYQEPGFIATSYDNRDISSSVNVTIDQPINSNVNNSTYGITYTITDNGYTVSLKRTIMVRDTTKPVITIRGNIEVGLSSLKDINLLQGVSVDDNSGESISVEISDYEPRIGESTIIYRAADSSGNVAEERRIVKVSKNDENLIEVSFVPQGNPINSNGWAKSNFYVKTTVNSLYGLTTNKIKYCTTTENDCIPNTEYSGLEISSFITQEGTSNHICVQAVYEYGATVNSEIVCSDPYKLDKTKPILSGVNSVTVMKGNTVNLTNGITSNDVLSGVSGSYTYTPTSISTTTAGTYNVVYTVSDLAGNTNNYNRTIKVDAPMPTVSLVVEGTPFNSNGWANANFNVKVTAVDNSGLGISSIKYCVANSATCTPNTSVNNISLYSVPVTIEGTNIHVCAQTTDKNNKASSTVCSSAYQLDKTVPAYSSGSMTTSTLTSNYTDNLCPVADLTKKYYISTSSTFPSNTNTSFSTSNTYSLSCGTTYYGYVIATDKAFNTSTVTMVSSSYTSCPSSGGGGSSGGGSSCDYTVSQCYSWCSRCYPSQLSSCKQGCTVGCPDGGSC